MITIDGVTFNVPVVLLRRKGQFLDKFAERTDDGVLHRELIGVYFNYELRFGRTHDLTEYANLWQKLAEPVPFHTVKLPDEQGAFTFVAYISNLGDELLKSKGANYWQGLTVNFIARSPAAT